MQALPPPTSVFTDRKAKILQALGVPDDEYSDASPKGSVDEGIRDLIDEVNRADGFVTTSSCGGRVSVFLEGRKTAAVVSEGGDGNGEVGGDGQVAGVGGKGAGGTWLFVSHDPVNLLDGPGSWVDELGFQGLNEDGGCSGDEGERRWIHFKFEPMILHVLTSSMAHAQLLLRYAIQAGFRESGAVNLTSTGDNPVTPMVAIRSMGLGFESLLGYETSLPSSTTTSVSTAPSEAQSRRPTRHQLVPPAYLPTLMSIANTRFSDNTSRIDRFRNGFRAALRPPAPRTNPDGLAWEDAAARRTRLRAEGLARAAAVAARNGGSGGGDEARGDDRNGSPELGLDRLSLG